MKPVISRRPIGSYRRVQLVWRREMPVF